ncbi:TPA: hypothetical protein ACIBE3_000761 [Salmonella enterica subsp. enterica serovar Reading]
MNTFLSKYDAAEKGALLNCQFQIGDYVTATPDSISKPGEIIIRGWIVGVTYTVSRIFYDVAEDNGTDLCRIHRRLRCFMRRESDLEETNFISLDNAKELFESPLLDDITACYSVPDFTRRG